MPQYVITWYTVIAMFMPPMWLFLTQCHKPAHSPSIWKSFYKHHPMKIGLWGWWETPFSRRFWRSKGTDNMVMANQYIIPMVAPTTGPAQRQKCDWNDWLLHPFATGNVWCEARLLRSFTDSSWHIWDVIYTFNLQIHKEIHRLSMWPCLMKLLHLPPPCAWTLRHEELAKISFLIESIKRSYWYQFAPGDSFRLPMATPYKFWYSYISLYIYDRLQ